MNKVIIIHENSTWLEPIAKAIHEIALPMEEWFLDDQGSITLSEEPPDALYFNRMSPSAHTRRHYRAYEHTSAILSWLESHNKRIINGSLAWQLENSKVAQYNALSKFNVQVPHTVAAFSKEDLLKKAGTFSTPFLIKHNRGGRGTGVHLVRSQTELEGYVQSEQFTHSPDGIYLLQRYIESSEPYVYRLEFIGKKFFYCVKINTQEGFDLCPADGCALGGAFCPVGSSGKFTVMRDFPDQDLIRVYESFLSRHSIEVAGIECIYDRDGELFTYDVNTNTNYNLAAEAQEGGLSAYGALAGFLRQRLHAWDALRTFDWSSISKINPS